MRSIHFALVVLSLLTACDENPSGADAPAPMDVPGSDVPTADAPGADGTLLFTVGGAITGLTGAGLVLANGADSIPLAAGATAFEFPTAIPSGTPYAVRVTTEPSGQMCTVAAGTGTVSGADVLVAVACVPVGSVPTLVVASGTATVDCDTFNAGGPVQPGDILELEAGVRGPLTIRDCAGSVTAPIIIRNDVTGAGPTIIRRTSGSQPALTLENDTNFVLDGTGKWRGAPAGTCGYDQLTGVVGGTNCGITVETEGGAGGFIIRMNGTTCAGTVLDPNHCAVRGVRIDGHGISDVGLSLNDHTVLFSANDGGPGTDDDLWRENITIDHNHLVDIGTTIGEGMYLGPNQDAAAPDLALRNIAIRNNYLERIARDCINTKSVLDGINYLEHNYGVDCGMSGETTQNRGLNLNGAAGYVIRGNRMIGMGGEGLLMTWQDLAGLSPGAAYTVTIENEIYARVGRTPGAMGHGARFTRNTSSPMQDVTIRNITIASASGDGVNCGTNTAIDVSNSIIAGAGGAAVAGCDADTGNRTGSVASQAFVDAATDDYELTAASPACDAARGSSPSVDYEGEPRPRGSASDQGADESAACP